MASSKQVSLPKIERQRNQEENIQRNDLETEKPKKLDLDALLAIKNELLMNKKRLKDHEAHLEDEMTEVEWENEYNE